MCAIASAALIATLLAVTPAFSAGSSSTLSPERFAAIASGVLLIRTSDCAGRTTGWGSGFLVGSRLVISARHVVDPPDGRPACRIDVRSGGAWIRVGKWNWWDSGTEDGRVVDLVTLRLNSPATGHVFQIRTGRVPDGTNLAMVGYPLGTNLALTQGKLITSKTIKGVPLIAVRLLGGEGASGAPFVDDLGRVVGIVQVALGSEDVLGQHTAGVVVGLDLVSWWGGSAGRDLCKAYPAGGVPGCVSGFANATDSSANATDSSAKATDSRALGLSAMIRATDIDFEVGDSGTWSLKSTWTPKAEGPCARYVRSGSLFGQGRTFTNNLTGDSFDQYVRVFGSSAAAQAAYALTASDANLDCFAESHRADLERWIPGVDLTGFVAYPMPTPRFGTLSSGGAVRWELTDPTTGEAYSGVIFWVDAVAGRTLHGFQLFANDYEGRTALPLYPSFISAYTPLIRAAVNSTR